MIVFDIIIFFFKEWDLKKVRIYKYTYWLLISVF